MNWFLYSAFLLYTNGSHPSHPRTLAPRRDRERNIQETFLRLYRPLHTIGGVMIWSHFTAKDKV